MYLQFMFESGDGSQRARVYRKDRIRGDGDGPFVVEINAIDYSGEETPISSADRYFDTENDAIVYAIEATVNRPGAYKLTKIES